jgi:hypothetical protein
MATGQLIWISFAQGQQAHPACSRHSALEGATAREVAMNGRLVKELLVILLIKLALLMVIKSLWFSAPTVPPDATQAVSAHLLD